MKAGVGLVLLGFLCAAPVPALAAQHSWSCWYAAAARYHVDPVLLYAVARVETHSTSGVVSAKNDNGSYDIGVMQINSTWLPALAHYGITESVLRHDACVNVMVGAWILSQTIREYGLNWNGVGAYNASTPWKRARYATKVAAEIRKARVHAVVAETGD